MNTNNKVVMPEPTNNYKKERVGNLLTYATFLVVAVAIMGSLFAYNKRSDLIAFIGGDFAATDEEVAGIDESTLNGYSYAFGTEPSDPIDYTTYTLPEPNKELEAEYYEALQTSPAFEWIDNVNEILEYDDFDKDGNVKEEAMRNIIAIAKESEE